MVMEQRASLVSFRVFAETYPQRTSRYSSAKAYQPVWAAPGPFATRPKSPAAADLTARTSEAPSSSGSALTSAPSSAVSPHGGASPPWPHVAGVYVVPGLLNSA